MTDRPSDEIRQRVERIAKLLRLELLKEDAVSLHSSVKQRIALGRAIVRDPKVLLLDEPLSNIDAKLRETHERRIEGAST